MSYLLLCAWRAAGLFAVYSCEETPSSVDFYEDHAQAAGVAYPYNNAELRPFTAPVQVILDDPTIFRDSFE